MRKYIVLTVFVTVSVLLESCTEKATNNGDNDRGKNTSSNSAFYDAGKLENLAVQHQQGSVVVMNYRNGKELFSLENDLYDKKRFFLFLGEQNIGYPGALIIYPKEDDKATKAYHFYKQTGILQKIINTDGNEVLQGPYYKFNNDGMLIVSGLYKSGKATGIWRLYNNKGEIIETINADTTTMNILKKFGDE